MCAVIYILSLNNMVEKIYGAPGTGKTHTLFRKMKEKGLHPRDCAFTTFSNAGVQEIKQRAKKEFPSCTEDGLKWFRTQHSINKRLLGLGNEQIANNFINDFAEEYKYFFPKISKKKHTDDEDFFFYYEEKNDSDIVLWNVYELGRKKMLSMEEMARLCGCLKTVFHTFVARYQEWCTKNQLFDFTGMIVEGLRQQVIPPVKALFVDEFQDNCKLQATQILEWSKKIPYTVVAGDDDQAIFPFAGADPKILIDFPCNASEILGVTHRYGEQIRAFSEKIINQNKIRTPKNVIALHDNSLVTSHKSLYQILEKFIPYWNEHKDESWFFLSRNNKFVYDITRELKERGLPVDIDHEVAFAYDLMTTPAPTMITSEMMQILVDDIFPARTHWVHGSKKLVLQKLKAKQFHDIPWADGMHYGLTLQFYDDHARNDISNLRCNPRDLEHIQKVRTLFADEMPNITVSTIHGVKGKEADNVVIIPDIFYSNSKTERYQEEREAERRIWYVAITRAKKHVFLIDRQQYGNYCTTII